MKIERESEIVVRKKVESAFGGEFSFLDENGGPTPVFIHPRSGLRFRYIPGGEFVMGLSEKEEEEAKAICDPIQANVSEMRPPKSVRLKPFLIAERPVLNSDIGVKEYETSAAYVSFDLAQRYATHFHMSLPSEEQWEYACRAGTTSLFTFGNTLPDDAALAKWLTFDFAAGEIAANGFGLTGLFVGEWCSDFFSDSYGSENTYYAENQIRTVRGGGAFFWPWQGEEWVWCMSAMRIPSTDLPNGDCGFRFVRSFS